MNKTILTENDTLDRIMIVPWEELSKEALHNVIEEYVTRDGTELTDADEKIAQVRRCLRKGDLVITWDIHSRICNILPAESVRRDTGDRG